MESVGMDYDDHMQETLVEQFMSLDSSGSDGTTDDGPAPRIGDEYQAVLPPLQQDLDCLPLICRSSVENGTTEWELKSHLAVPISWIRHPAYVDNVIQQCRLGGSDVYEAISGSYTPCHVEEHVVDNTAETAGCCDNRHQLNAGKMHTEGPASYIPVPCDTCKQWADDEIERLVLGLYIFGKNLVHVQRFVESKEMGDVLAHYYGKFYMGKAYRRWVECKKSKGRKRMDGHHLLAGWRQHELLSRLLCNASEESRKSLLEATRMFNEHSMSLEDYAFALKSIVGAKALVEAVGIGKGKYDLTSMVVDPARGSQARPIHSEIPIGKACSSLTDAEIVKFLTGDYRLSKARSNDLFWEAVWPRLLARGWHSEQPKDQVYAAQRQLVFLAPGIKKFSRRKLTKGDHYFDSVSDVLSKVALDPRILEIGIEHVNGTSAVCNVANGPCTTGNDHGSKKRPQREQIDVTDKQHFNDIRPKPSGCSSHVMKFTVVDTSMAHDEAPFLVRQLRSLPLDVPFSNAWTDTSDETDSSSSKEQQDSSDASLSPDTSEDKKTKNAAAYKFEMGGNHYRTHSDYWGYTSQNNEEKCDGFRFEDPKPDNKPDKGLSNASQSVFKVPAIPKRKRAAFQTGKNALHPLVTDREKIIKLPFIQKTDGKPTFTSQISIAACSISENGQFSPSLPGGNHLSEEGGYKSKTFDAMVNLAAELCETESQINSSGICNAGVITEQEYERRAMIDLNLPSYPLDFDANGQYTTEAPARQNYSHENATYQLETMSLPDELSGHDPCNRSDIEQQSMDSLRRQSTRSRPLTTRALEALESGFLNIKRRARGYKFPQPDSPRPPRRLQKTIGGSDYFYPGNYNDNIVGSTDMMDARGDDERSSYQNETALFSKSPSQMMEKGHACDFPRIN